MEVRMAECTTVDEADLIAIRLKYRNCCVCIYLLCQISSQLQTPPYHMVVQTLWALSTIYSLLLSIPRSPPALVCGVHYLKLLLCLPDTRWGLATGGVQRVQLSRVKGRQLTTLSCTEQTTTVPLSYSGTSTSRTMNRRESHSHLLILEWDFVFLPHHRSNGSAQCVKLQSVH